MPFLTSLCTQYKMLEFIQCLLHVMPFTKTIISFVSSNNPILQSMRQLWLVIHIVNGRPEICTQVDYRFYSVIHLLNTDTFLIPISFQDQEKNSSPMYIPLTTQLLFPLSAPVSLWGKNLIFLTTDRISDVPILFPLLGILIHCNSLCVT